MHCNFGVTIIEAVEIDGREVLGQAASAVKELAILVGLVVAVPPENPTSAIEISITKIELLFFYLLSKGKTEVVKVWGLVVL